MTPMERLFDSSKALPSIPRVMQEILATLNKEDFEVDEITRPLQQDPAMSAKVLRMANSAHYRQQRAVSSVDDAVVLVGLDAIRTMVIASGLVGSFSAIEGFDMQRFWRLSLLSGYIAKDLARKVKLSHNTAYTASLMHGLGVLSIHNVFPKAAQEIDKVCHDHSATERARYEKDKLGFHHGEVGAEIANRWKLPEEIGEAIRYYATPSSEYATPMAGLVHCAVALAIDLEDDIPVDQWGNKVDSDVTTAVGIDWDAVRYREDAIRQQREMADAVVS